MKPPRYFVLTGGNSHTDAIDLVELRGHQLVSVRLTRACSVPVYGIAEVDAPEAAAERRAVWAATDRKVALAIASAAHDEGRHWRGDIPNCPKCKGSPGAPKPC